jgi:hypothetical protein
MVDSTLTLHLLSHSALYGRHKPKPHHEHTCRICIPSLSRPTAPVEADLVFHPNPSDRARLDELHETVLHGISGARTKCGIWDSVVAIRQNGFNSVVNRLSEHYLSLGYTVTVR